MPIYEYFCNHCEKSFELKEGFDAEPVATCPICERQAKRQFHAVAVIYKGSGFYTTDYKRSGANSSSSGSHDAEAEKSAKNGKKDEASESPAKKDETAESPAKKE